MGLRISSGGSVRCFWRVPFLPSFLPSFCGGREKRRFRERIESGRGRARTPYLWNDLHCPLSGNVHGGRSPPTAVRPSPSAPAQTPRTPTSLERAFLRVCVPHLPKIYRRVPKVTCCGKTRPLPRRRASLPACDGFGIARECVNICHMAPPPQPVGKWLALDRRRSSSVGISLFFFFY